MKVILGETQVSLLNPPNDGEVWDKQGRVWKIGRTGSGNIILRPSFSGFQPHEDFLPDGMNLLDFCNWINTAYNPQVRVIRLEDV